MISAGVTPALDLPWPAWHRAAFVKGSARTFPDTAVVRSWFRSRSDKFNEVSFSVLVRYDMGSEIEQWALANEDRYRSLYGSEVDDLRMGIASRCLSRAIDAKDTVLLRRAKQLLPGDEPRRRAWNDLNLDATYYRSTGSWKDLGRILHTMAAYEDMPGRADAINENAWKIYEDSDDREAIDDALQAMAVIVALPDPDWAHVDTYAALLFASGKLDEARAAAQRAIALGSAKGADVSETRALLKKIETGKK
jgi:tetratricopeptide (TPR) repeat protein